MREALGNHWANLKESLSLGIPTHGQLSQQPRPPFVRKPRLKWSEATKSVSDVALEAPICFSTGTNLQKEERKGKEGSPGSAPENPEA